MPGIKETVVEISSVYQYDFIFLGLNIIYAQTYLPYSSCFAHGYQFFCAGSLFVFPIWKRHGALSFMPYATSLRASNFLFFLDGRLFEYP